MIATVTVYVFIQGKMEQMSQLVNEEVGPTLKGTDGVSQTMFLLNGVAGKILAIGIWETKEQAEAYFRGSLFREITAKLKPVLAGPPVYEFYDVNYQTFSGSTPFGG